MTSVAVRSVYTADAGNLWTAKKVFTPTDPFAIAMFVETDAPAGTAFDAHFQIVNPRVQAGNWARPVAVPGAQLSLSVESHGHTTPPGTTTTAGGPAYHSHDVYPAIANVGGAHSHFGTLAVPGVTVDRVAQLSVPGPAFVCYYLAGTYSAMVAGLQGSDVAGDGFFYVRGLVSIGGDDTFDHSGEFWYRVRPGGVTTP